MTINIKDINGYIVEISDQSFSNMIEQLYQESEFDSSDIEAFIEWIEDGCLIGDEDDEE